MAVPVPHAVAAAVAANVLPVMQYGMEALPEAVQPPGIVRRLSIARRRGEVELSSRLQGGPVGAPHGVSRARAWSAGAHTQVIAASVPRYTCAGPRGARRGGAGWQRPRVACIGLVRRRVGVTWARDLAPCNLTSGAAGSGPLTACTRPISRAVVERVGSGAGGRSSASPLLEDAQWIVDVARAGALRCGGGRGMPPVVSPVGVGVTRATAVRAWSSRQLGGVTRWTL